MTDKKLSEALDMHLTACESAPSTACEEYGCEYSGGFCVDCGLPLDPDDRLCPMHSDCEKYLPQSACPYRSGQMTYEQAENAADGPAAVGDCDEWADSE
jgi:hypothetical protein